MAREKKDPFAAIPVEYRDSAAGSDPEAIKGMIAKAAMDDADLRKAMEEDEDLKHAKEQASIAGEVYREGFKMNRLKIKFLKQVLEDKGKA